MKMSRWLQNKTKAILRCARRRPQAAILGLISLTMRKRRWPLKRNFICGLWIVGVDWPSQSTGRSEPGGDPQERWDGPLWVVSPSRGGFCSDSVKSLIFKSFWSLGCSRPNCGGDAARRLSRVWGGGGGGGGWNGGGAGERGGEEEENTQWKKNTTLWKT